MATTRSASGAILSARSTAAIAIGESSDKLSDWSLRSSWCGPKLAMPRSTTLVATSVSP